MVWGLQDFGEGSCLNPGVKFRFGDAGRLGLGWLLVGKVSGLGLTGFGRG